MSGFLADAKNHYFLHENLGEKSKNLETFFTCERSEKIRKLTFRVTISARDEIYLCDGYEKT